MAEVVQEMRKMLQDGWRAAMPPSSKDADRVVNFCWS